jgi:uncharacterized protein YhjY with autotransporter beta-barrel domain
MWTPYALDLTTQLIGQDFGEIAAFGYNGGGSGDFNFTAFSDDSAPSYVNYFTIGAYGGVGDQMQLTSWIPYLGTPPSNPGPSSLDTQTSLQNSVPYLQGVFALESSSLNDILAYDCDTSDSSYIALGGRINSVYSTKFHRSSVLVTGAYRVNEHARIALWLDQSFVSNAKNGISLHKNKPMVGLYGLWNEQRSGQGLEGKFAVVYGQQELSVSRAVVGSSEPGSGTTNLTSQGASLDLSKNIFIDERTMITPFGAFRYTKTKAKGYTETATDTVTEPLTYADLIQESSTLLAGLKVLTHVDNQASFYGSLGLELDVSNKDSGYSVTGMNDLTSINFNPEIRILRPTATLGGSYQFSDEQQVNLKASYRKESFDDVHALSVMMTYGISF